MFQTFIADALQENIIHQAIVSMIQTMMQHLNDGTETPQWPQLIPEYARESLRTKNKMRRLLRELKELLNEKPDERRRVEECLECLNNIHALLDGTHRFSDLEALEQDCDAKLREIFEEGFELLKKTGIRDIHYKTIYNALKSKTCPFCGYMPLDAPSDKLKREDLDHYLDRQTYPFAAANLENLVPTCSKCNSRYKGTANLIFKDNGTHRKAFLPYGDACADICLRETNPFELNGNSINWRIKLMPDIEEVETWNAVYKVQDRLLESVLSPNYENTLDEMIDFFNNTDVNSSCSDEELSNAINNFYNYKRDNPEQGLGFLKHKIVDMLRCKLEQNDTVIQSMIRAGLRQPAEGQAA